MLIFWLGCLYAPRLVYGDTQQIPYINRVAIFPYPKHLSQLEVDAVETRRTKRKYRCLPQIISNTPRYIKFGVELVPDDEASPLDGSLRLSPSGSWEYKIYAVNQHSITPTSSNLLESGLMKLEAACEEIPEYVYVSPNEIESSVVYLSNDCTDTCLAWNTSTFWQLANQTWNCDEDCATFGGDPDEFDDDTNYFVECLHE